MVKALFDTNILIDQLNAIPEARAELARFADKAISLVTWLEVMAGAPAKLADATRAYLAGFQTLGIDFPIAERAVALRKAHRLKLPDALIWATAQHHAMLLVTRNTKDFPAADPGVRHPYVL
jgi:predicted nucleic acid-binding protein